MMDISKTIKIGRGQFQTSPFFEKFANDKIVMGVYAGRSYPITWGQNTLETYRALRTESVLFDVPERPVEICGPDALKLLEKVLARSISNLKIGKARYAIACLENGGILMDGVVMHLEKNRYWYVKADGEFDTWLKAHANGLDVQIIDPNSWVLQLQGPASLKVMKAATNGMLNEGFGYFNVGWFEIGGQQLLVSRSGWTGELGYEIYTQGAKTNAHALWDFLLESGRNNGLISSALDSMNIRRIEAGICNNLTDIDETMTPFQAGLGALVDLEKSNFIGREALINSNRDCLLFGFRTLPGKSTKNFDDIDLTGSELYIEKKSVGTITASAVSPYLQCLIGYVRLYQEDDWIGKLAKIYNYDGGSSEVQICKLPFYDQEKDIPRNFNGKGPEF